MPPSVPRCFSEAVALDKCDEGLLGASGCQADQWGADLSRAGNEPAATVLAGLLSLATSKSISICDTGLALQLPPSCPLGPSEITPGIGSNLHPVPEGEVSQRPRSGPLQVSCKDFGTHGTVSWGPGCCGFLRPQEGGNFMTAYSAHWSWGVNAQPSPPSPCLTWRGSLEFCTPDPSGCSRISLNLLLRCWC